MVEGSNLKSVNAQAMEGVMVEGAAAAGEVRADAELVPFVTVPRDVERVHGGSLDWMFDIPAKYFSLATYNSQTRQEQRQSRDVSTKVAASCLVWEL